MPPSPRTKGNKTERKTNQSIFMEDEREDLIREVRKANSDGNEETFASRSFRLGTLTNVG